MIAAIIQARTGSTRLPNKVFKNLCGKPLIWHIVNRLKYSQRIEKIILATTSNTNDDILEQWCVENTVSCYRGSENNVLDRYYKAACHFSVDTIVRITADDPFKDPEVIDKVVDLFNAENLDFANNNNPPTFPEGLDTEVFSFSALENAWMNANDDFEKEHVTQFFYRNAILFKQKCLRNELDQSFLRWTIDTQLDWDMAEQIYSRLFPINEVFKMADILRLLEREPYLAEINMNVARSTMYKKN